MLVSHIGWDELLKSRSQVFVMEEEYRMQKVQADASVRASSTSNSDLPPGSGAPAGAVIYEDGTVQFGDRAPPAASNGGALPPVPGADDNASTRALVGESIDPAASPASQKTHCHQ